MVSFTIRPVLASRSRAQAAGLKLGVSASAVGKAVTRLEVRLDLRLMHRTMRSLALTAEGELLYARSARILDDGREGENAISKARAVPKGRLQDQRADRARMARDRSCVAVLRGAYREVELDLWLDDRKVDIVDEDFDAVFGWANSLTLILSRGRSCLTISQPAQRKAILLRTGPQKRRLNSSPIAAYDTAFPLQDGSSNGAFKGTSAPQALGGGLVLNDDEGRWQASGWFRFRPTSFQRTWRPDVCNVCSRSVPPTVATYGWSGQRCAPTSHVSAYSLTSFRSCLQRRRRRTGNMELRACSVMRQTVSLDGGLICTAEGVTIGNPNSHLGCRQAAEEPSRCCHAPWLMVNLP
jgi:hypothetical protein